MANALRDRIAHTLIENFENAGMDVNKRFSYQLADTLIEILGTRKCARCKNQMYLNEFPIQPMPGRPMAEHCTACTNFANWTSPPHFWKSEEL